MKSGTLVILMALMVSCQEIDEITQKNSSNSENNKSASITTINTEDTDVRWKETDFPVEIKLSDNWSPEMMDIIEDALVDWEDVGQKDFFSETEIISSPQYTLLKDYYTKDKKNQGIYFSEVKIVDMPDSALATCQLFMTNAKDANGEKYLRIMSADIVFNGFVHNFSIDPNDPETYDLRSTILHELGHFLGLKHSSSGVMQSSQGKHSHFEDIELEDIEALIALYANSEESNNNKNKSKALQTEESEQNNEVYRVLLHFQVDKTVSIHIESAS